ncbi:DUF6484 domain-containing protein [Azohydromonas caseinilytica]|uniref:DUF6484 domain-containing protein n=1 Tax=Azohydromonas caseinilytica TaxID=2728836 RepID=A0A848F8R9_9BURK|nr:DUF6484 domain-containing protein [Azohydromonas caseinilytica]NML16537.1 hypothetical protein [Azohydromonas caseinilytica]
MGSRERFEAWAPAVQLGELVALADDGATALVIDPQQLDAPARRARSVVDLHAAHIGRSVVLAFEGGDPARPIVMGVLRGGPERPAAMAVEADGERMIVSAEHQLVLRCGKASITLTRAGKVLIEGSYLLSRSTGVNRIQGGSVQLN